MNPSPFHRSIPICTPGARRNSAPGQGALAGALLAAAVMVTSVGALATQTSDVRATAQDGPQVPVWAVAPRGAGMAQTHDGVVEPQRQATVSSQTGGRVLQMTVRAGDRVRAGQLLAVLDDREAQAASQRVAAQIAEAEAQLRQAQANHRRNEGLRAQGFISQAAVDQSLSQLQAAQAAREQALAAQRQAQATQSHARVTAPFDGVVAQTLAEPGDLALPGTPLLRIHAPAPLRVTVRLPLSVVPVAQAAQRVEILSADASAQVWTPTSRQWLPAADPVSQTLEWRLGLPDGTGLMPGQTVRVRFAAEAAAAVSSSERLLLPSAAVLRRGELTAVYVAQPQGFALRAVRLGADHGAAGVEVLAGLRPGEVVALDAVRAGLAGARPGARREQP